MFIGIRAGTRGQGGTDDGRVAFASAKRMDYGLLCAEGVICFVWVMGWGWRVLTHTNRSIVESPGPGQVENELPDESGNRSVGWTA
jgi:hypothetical protein